MLSERKCLVLLTECQEFMKCSKCSTLFKIASDQRDAHVKSDVSQIPSPKAVSAKRNILLYSLNGGVNNNIDINYPLKHIIILPI